MIGTVVKAGGKTGVVIGARPVAQPSKVVVLWQPLEQLKVTEHDWPPTQAQIVGVVDAKVKARAKRPPRPPGLDEPIGFGQWLGFHSRKAESYGMAVNVPAAGTTRRAKLAQTYARLAREGMNMEDFELASLGVLDDEFMRKGGHVGPENVLRVEKIGSRVDAGRRVQASGAADWGRFDG